MSSQIFNLNWFAHACDAVFYFHSQKESRKEFSKDHRENVTIFLTRREFSLTFSSVQNKNKNTHQRGVKIVWENSFFWCFASVETREKYLKIIFNSLFRRIHTLRDFINLKTCVILLFSFPSYNFSSSIWWRWWWWCWWDNKSWVNSSVIFQKWERAWFCW